MTAEHAFSEIAEDLAPRGVESGPMFGKPGLKFGGKAFACFHRERLALKLGAGSAEHDRALKLSGAELFDPSGKGRPFKDWVAVPFAESEHWPRLAEAALELLAGAAARDNR